jgi:uncharacterized protein YcfL
MRETALIALFALTACGSSPQRQVQTPQRMCVMDQPEQWEQMATPPHEAETLIGLADSHPVFKSRLSNRESSWFQTSDARLMLCRHDWGCSGEYWIFQRSDQGWRMQKSDGWVCVT